MRLNKYNVTVWLIESESSSLGAMNVLNNELKVGQLKSQSVVGLKMKKLCQINFTSDFF